MKQQIKEILEIGNKVMDAIGSIVAISFLLPFIIPMFTVMFIMGLPGFLIKKTLYWISK